MSYKGQIQPLNLDFQPKEKKDCGCGCNSDKNCANGNINVSNIPSKLSLMKNAINLPGNSSSNQLPPISPPQLNSNNNSKYFIIAVGIIILYSMKS
jgi:hypothetical protein